MKKIVSLLLAICLLIGLMPTTAFAEGESTEKLYLIYSDPYLIGENNVISINEKEGYNLEQYADISKHDIKEIAEAPNSSAWYYFAKKNANGEYVLVDDVIAVGGTGKTIIDDFKEKNKGFRIEKSGNVKFKEKDGNAETTVEFYLSDGVVLQNIEKLGTDYVSFHDVNYVNRKQDYGNYIFYDDTRLKKADGKAYFYIVVGTYKNGLDVKLSFKDNSEHQGVELTHLRSIEVWGEICKVYEISFDKSIDKQKLEFVKKTNNNVEQAFYYGTQYYIYGEGKWDRTFEATSAYDNKSRFLPYMGSIFVDTMQEPEKNFFYISYLGIGTESDKDFKWDVTRNLIFLEGESAFVSHPNNKFIEVSDVQNDVPGIGIPVRKVSFKAVGNKKYYGGWSRINFFNGSKPIGSIHTILNNAFESETGEETPVIPTDINSGNNSGNTGTPSIAPSIVPAPASNNNGEGQVNAETKTTETTIEKKGYYSDVAKPATAVETKIEDKEVDKLVSEAVSTKAKEVIIDATAKNKPTAPVMLSKVEIPTKLMSKIGAETDADVTVKTDIAKLKLDNKASEEISKQAGEENVTLSLDKVYDGDDSFEIEMKFVTQSGKEINNFNGGRVSATVKLPKDLADAKEMTCLFLDSNGRLYRVKGQTNGDGTFTFETGHFSRYKVLSVDDANKAFKEQKDYIKSVKYNLKSNVSTRKNGKKAITLKLNGKTEIGLDGIEIFRSLKKNSGYGKEPYKVISREKYVNTQVKSGNKYFYKARGFAMVDGEKIYTEFSNKTFKIVG